MSFSASAAESNLKCSGWFSVLRPSCHRIHKLWTTGHNAILLSGYAWHNRYTYTPEKIRSYNEAALGGGFGKALFDENGNWHSMQFNSFLDSHSQVEAALGYTFLKVKPLTADFKAGLGYAAFLTSRADILNRIPFPGALPCAAIFYKHLAINAMYIPGGSNNGNVMYLYAQYTF